MKEEDVKDKITAKEKRREKRLKKKKVKTQLEDTGPTVTLINPSNDVDHEFDKSNLMELSDSKSDKFGIESNHSRRASTSEFVESSEEEVTFKNKRRKVLEVEEPLTLADQEELALKLLEKR